MARETRQIRREPHHDLAQGPVVLARPIGIERLREREAPEFETRRLRPKVNPERRFDSGIALPPRETLYI